MHQTESNQSTLAILKPLSAFNYLLSKLAIYLAGALMAAMVGMILAQVFYRYVLNDSLSWTEEMAKFSMVWIAFLVAPWVYKQNLNVSIQMFADAFPALLKHISELLITCLIIFICVVFFIQSVDFWLGGLTISASSVPVKLAVFYSCAPFSFGLLSLLAFERLIEQSYSLYCYCVIDHKATS